MRCVRRAMAASAIQGSATGMTGANVTSSHKKKPSQPADSASAARSANTRMSANGPNGGMWMPKRIADMPPSRIVFTSCVCQSFSVVCGHVASSCEVHHLARAPPFYGQCVDSTPARATAARRQDSCPAEIQRPQPNRAAGHTAALTRCYGHARDLPSATRRGDGASASCSCPGPCPTVAGCIRQWSVV